MGAASTEEIAALVAELDRERQAWIEGRFDAAGTALLVQEAAMTLFGPFGGEAVGPSPMQAKVAALFHGGTGGIEVVQAVADGDLVVLVLVERSAVRFAQDDTPRPWVLRTTQVFRRDGARWLRLHRHADPLIARRTLAETLVVAAPPGIP